MKNIGASANSTPSEPANLFSGISGDQATMQWGFGSDDITPIQTYNLRVGTTSGGNEIMSSMTGSRLIPDFGNVSQNTFWTLKELDPGTYFYSVQSIDGSFKGSVFSSESTFVIDPDITRNLFAYYPFNGNALDESGNVLDGTVVSATLTTDFIGTASSAYEFDGIDDKISLPVNADNSKELTLSAWIFKTKVDDFIYQGIVGNDDSSERGVYISVNTTDILEAGIATTDGVTFFVEGSDVPENVWTFVAMTYDGTELKVYQNGILTGTTPANGIAKGSVGFEIGLDIFDAA